MSFLYRLGRSMGMVGSPTYTDKDSESKPVVRIGILGAASIAPMALIYPAKLNKNVKIQAVAARDGKRAQAFAKKFGIPKTYDSYEALLADPDIDAVYVPSPNGLHFKWAVKSLEAGKHVLCEKPITANAEEAEALVACATKTGKILMEAAHSFHHPALLRAREIIRSGEIGELRHIKACLKIPGLAIPGSDIRYDVNGTQRHLAGGSFMDTGSYVSNCVRYLTDLEVKECTSAKAVEKFPGVDESMEAELLFEGSAVTGKVSTSMVQPFYSPFSAEAEVVGTKGSVRIYNYVGCHVYHRIYITSAESGKTRTETAYGADGLGRSTYEYQLAAFVKCIHEQKEGGVARTVSGGTIDNFVGCMKMIDAVYEKSGLGKRIGAGLA